MESQKFSQTQYKILAHFTINLIKLINFFLVKTLKKARFITNFCFLRSRYGARTGTCQKSEPEPLPEVGIGTGKK